MNNKDRNNKFNENKENSFTQDVKRFTSGFKGALLALIALGIPYITPDDVVAKSIKTPKNNFNVEYLDYKHTNTDKFLNYKNEVDLQLKINKVLDDHTQSYLINVYGGKIKKEELSNLIVKGIISLDDTIKNAWNTIVINSTNYDGFKYIKNNLISAYGNENVIDAMRGLVLIENIGHENTIRDILQFYVEIGMSNEIDSFKNHVKSHKDARGLCQLTYLAFKDVNKNIFKMDNEKDLFEKIIKNNYFSIMYMMGINAINYDRLMSDISLNKKESRYEKKDTDIAFLLKNIKDINIKRDAIQFLLAVSYNNGYSYIKEVGNSLINKRNLNPQNHHMIEAIIRNLSTETKTYAQKLGKVNGVS